MNIIPSIKKYVGGLEFNGKILFELGYCALWAGLYLIAASLAVSYAIEAYIAAGFFGFCAMIVYGIDAFYKYQALKTGQLAQGDRMISRQSTTTVTTPSAYP
ncbi:hypothetical protein HUJ05_003379 [Dendroctonus ponderosae]|nr:hypothetical protein HUJ05_003379 [Dendroctonus ponderosae]